MTLGSPASLTSGAAWRATPGWRQVLAALDQPAPENVGEALPIARVCPLCNDPQLLILHDGLNNSQWYCCTQCDFAGGPERLAAAVLNGSFSDGSAAIFGHLLPDAELTLREHCLDAQYQTARAVWESAQKGLADGRGVLTKTAYAAGLRLPNSSWDAETTFQVVGGLPADEFLTTIVGSTERLSKSRSLPSSIVARNGQPVFPASFTDVVLAPFYDQPGRIANFFVVGGSKYTTKQTLLRLRPDAGAGLAYHPRLLTDSRPVLAVRDPLIGIRLQLRQFAADPAPLPVVTWLSHSGCKTTVDDWRGFLASHSRPIVFWTEKFCLDSVHQAILVDGAISTRGIEETTDTVTKFLSRLSASDTVNLLIAESLPWRDYLYEQLKTMQDAEATNLLQQLLRLGVSAELLEPVCRRAPRLARSFSLVNTTAPGLRVITLENGSRLEERNETWVVLKTSGEETISPAVVRVNKAVNYPKSSAVWYQGVVHFGGKALPFLAPSQTLENNLGGWLHRFLLDNQCGYHPIAPRWAKKLFQIAIKFQRPEVLTGVETMGWDESRRRFNMATFSINDKGEAAKLRSLVLESLPQPPAAIPPPRPNKLSLLALRRFLNHGLLTNASWGLACAVVGNVLAPALHEDRRGVACVGETGELALRLTSRVLGCAEFPLSPAALEAEQRHNWPAVLQIDKAQSPRALKDFAEQTTAPRNCLMACSLAHAVPLLLSGGWEVFDYPEEGNPDDTGVSAAVLGELVSEFLAQSCKEHHASVLSAKGPLTARVHASLNSWLTETYGLRPEQLPALEPNRWLSVGNIESCFHAFSALLYELVRGGYMELTPVQFHNVKNACWYTNMQMFVPRQDFVAAVAKLGCALWPANVTAVLEKMSNSGFREERVNGHTCWVFTKPRWRAAVANRQPRRARLSKIGE